MIRSIVAFALLATCLTPLAAKPVDRPVETSRLKAQAAGVTITRDTWGIAHVHGKTDADAVFGMVYAQAEDDFNRVETNYLVSLGRLAEAEGDKAIWQDLRQRLYIDPEDLKRQYSASPAWLKSLMNAWADGLNYYLATHPAVHPRAITHFEPWMALSFSEGSIGGDIERVDLKGLEGFYGPKRVSMLSHTDPRVFVEPKGSNGIAIAPANTRDGHALLLINPHTSFYFRSELQMTSDQGLNAYGAVTWGQFFIYQGFNAHAGWMHTSSGVDSVDEFLETIVDQGGRKFYRYGNELRPVTSRTITLAYRATDGSMQQRSFTTYATHHGPITRMDSDKWVAFALMNTPVAALEQSFLRTKTSDIASFQKVAELRANSSNDTVFADDKGEVAYLHPQFVPRRDDRFDYQKPVDGSNPATDWHGLHSLNELPTAIAPKVGWIMNTNNAPWSVAGPDSPSRSAYPRYMDSAGENPRGLHATKLLTGRHDFTLEGLRQAAYDPFLPAFVPLVPALAAAWDELEPADPLKARLAAPIAALRDWDFKWDTESVPTALAIYWANALWGESASFLTIETGGMARYHQMLGTPPTVKLKAFEEAVDRLTQDFGTWNTTWGTINRFQRLDDSIAGHFDDAGPSIAVPFTSSQWGSLASFGVHRYPGGKRQYGVNGNSFVAVVEFGPRVKARAVTAGGESGDVNSPHFKDQAERYAAGDLRDVYFYPEDVTAHVERRYRPGE